MCGIAGEVRGEGVMASDVDGQPASSVAEMLRAMRYRGPDESRVVQDGPATLGCCRLAIVDVADGRQPMISQDGRYAIVYNGECYDLATLRDRLSGAGVRRRTQSDTEVVLEAFARWGASALEYLNGMFALAIWDRRTRRLFLARDRLGIKPLYYALLPDRFLFASNLDALIQRPDVPADPAPEALPLYLSTRGLPGAWTPYRHVRKLPPGHCATFAQGQLRASCWWDLPLEAAGPRRVARRPALAELDGLLEQATRRRLISERPLGLCLSGGVDSGLIASYLPGGTPGFSLGFKQSRYDESTAAGQTAEHLGLPHHLVSCPADPEGLLDEAVAHLDEPLGDSSLLAFLALAREIREHVTVVLSGTGGDELFNGYPRHLIVHQARAAGCFPGVAPALRALADWPARLGWSGASRALGAVDADPVRLFAALVAPAPPAVLRRLLEREELADEVSDAVYRPHFDRSRGWPLAHRLSYLETKTVLPDVYLVKEDRMGMAASLEGRFPMLDYRLAEWAFRLPVHLRLRGGRTKRLLRDLALIRLPRTVARGRKRGFEVPLAGWLRGPLRERLGDALLEPSSSLHAACNPRVLERLVAEHLAGSRDHGRLLFTLLIWESWRRRAVRGTPPARPREAAWVSASPAGSERWVP